MDWELLSQVWWLSYSVDAAATLQHVLCSVKSVKKYCSHTHSYVQHSSGFIAIPSPHSVFAMQYEGYCTTHYVLSSNEPCSLVRLCVCCVYQCFLHLINLFVFAFVWCGLMASCLCLHCVVFWSVWLGTSAPLLFYLIGYDDVAMLWLCHMVVLLVTTVTLKRFIWRYRPYMVSRAKCVSEWVFDLWPLVLDL